MSTKKKPFEKPSTTAKMGLGAKFKSPRDSMSFYGRKVGKIQFVIGVLVLLPMLGSPLFIGYDLLSMDYARGSGPTIGVLRSFWLPSHEDPLEVRQRRAHNDAPWLAWLGLKHRNIPE